MTAAAAAAKLISLEPLNGCGYCRRSLQTEIRIECALCSPTLRLCVECFHAGIEIHTRGHCASHPYRVVDVAREALLAVGWLPDDELKLLEAMQLYGFGNWADIAEHVGGGRTRQQVEEHYRRCYLESPTFPEPNFARLEEERAGKKPKLEEGAEEKPPLSEHMRKAAEAAAVSAAAAQAAAGGQTFVPGPDPLEVGPKPPEADYTYAGWMPLRGEFDTEWEDDAELQTFVHELEFTPAERASFYAGEPTVETLEKLQRLHAYNATLDGRQWRRDLIVQRELLDDIHTQVELEKTAPVPEVALRARLRPFARFHSASEHEDLVQCFLRQDALAQAIRHLQTCRSKGIRSLAEAEAMQEAAGIGLLAPAAAAPAAAAPAAARATSSGKSGGGAGGARKVAGASRNARRAAAAEDDAAARGAAAAAAAEADEEQRREAAATLSSSEQPICEELSLPPHALMFAKRTLLLAAIASGGTLSRERAVKLLHPKLDNVRAVLVYDYCVKCGWVRGSVDEPPTVTDE